MPDLYKGIDNFIDSNNTSVSVTSKGLDELIHKVMAFTDVDKATVSLIVCALFQTIRTIMLQGDVAYFKEIGEFFISGPKTNGKKNVYPKFFIKKRINRKL